MSVKDLLQGQFMYFTVGAPMSSFTCVDVKRHYLYLEPQTGLLLINSTSFLKVKKKQTEIHTDIHKRKNLSREDFKTVIYFPCSS